MINLESFDQYGTVGRFNPVTGVINKAPRAQFEDVSFLGHFGTLGGRDIVFCRLHEILQVFDGTSSWLALARTVSWLSDGDRRVLKVESVEASTPLVIEYDSPDASLEGDYVTSFSSQEDWDFGLFIFAVVSDTNRAQRIYR